MSKYVDLSTGTVRDWVPVTPSDTTDNMKANATDVVVGFYVTGAGSVVFTVDGNDRTVNFPDNFFVPCAGVTRIKAATTASGIFSLVV